MNVWSSLILSIDRNPQIKQEAYGPHHSAVQYQIDPSLTLGLD